MDIEITFGATYRDTATGWEGVAQKPDVPVAEKTYQLADGTEDTEATEAVAVGPYPSDPGKWIVMIDDQPAVIDRGLLPLMWPQVGLHGMGPKGAPERRYFPQDRLEKVAG